MQLIANLAEQGIGGIKPEARDETRGLPLSDSRYPAGSTIAGDETKIRYTKCFQIAMKSLTMLGAFETLNHCEGPATCCLACRHHNFGSCTQQSLHSHASKSVAVRPSTVRSNPN